MESSGSRAAKLLQAKLSGRRKLMIFGGLALAIVLVTVAALVLHAQAMNYSRRVLECVCEPHEHTLEECGEPDARTCGLADYVVHVHNDDCYDEDGALVCPLPEIEPHTHDESCLVERKVLICEQEGITEEEAAALAAKAANAADAADAAAAEPEHVHTPECYGPAGRVLACGQEERAAHTHTDACYTPGERVLSCGQEERAAHTHTDACYTPGAPVLTCTDTSEGHVHTDGCYTPGAPVLSCGQEEQPGHTHSDACYTEGAPVLSCGQEEQPGHTHTDACYTEGEPVLVCGKGDAAPAGADADANAANIPLHVHTEECYETVTELGCGKLELHTHTDECYTTIEPENPEEEPVKVLTCTIPQLEEHVHGEACFATVELSPDEVAALKAQEMGIELHDLQLVYEDADVRVTVDYDTLSLVPQPAEAVLLPANTPKPEPTPNPLLPAVPADGENAGDANDAAPEGTQPPAEPQPEGEPAAQPAEPAPADAAPAPDAGEPAPEAADSAPETAAPQPETSGDAAAGAPAAETPDASAQGGSIDSELVRVGLTAEGREWLPAATVTYTVQYLQNGRPAGEPTQYVYTPGGELPVFPRSITRYYRECRTDAFIVTASYTALANLPEQAELRARLITDEEQVSSYESAYKEALNTGKAQMLSLLDIGFWLDEEEIQPAAPVSITVQLLGEDGLPAGEPITVVHFADGGAEVLPASVDENGAAAFNMNGFSLVALGDTPEADEEGRVMMDHTFDWEDESGLFRVKFHITGIAGPYKEQAEGEDVPAADAAASGEAGAEPADAPEAGAAAPAETDETDKTDAASAEDGETAAAGAPETDAAAGADASEDTDTSTPADAPADADAPAIDTADVPRANDSYLNFSVETLGEDDAAYAAYAEYAAGTADAAELLNLAVMRYTLTYGDVEMDLSACEIEVTITPTARMELAAAAYQLENPADNGDDDGDGYVLAADGESLLPAPETDTAVLFSAIAPAAESDALLTEQGMLEVGGEEYAQLVENEDTAALAGAAFPAEGEPEEEAQEESVSAVLPDAPAPQQTITFTMPDEAAVAPEMARTFAARTATDTNPTFYVQYYSELEVLKIDGNANDGNKSSRLQLIDTDSGKTDGTGGDLPQNKHQGRNVSPNGRSLKYMYIDTANGNRTITEKKWTEIYRSRIYQYQKAPSIKYMDALIEQQKHYTLQEIWVHEDSPNCGAACTDTTGAHWDRYTPEAIHFTNRQVTAEADANYVLIQNNTVIRLIYKTETANPDFPVAFYDYDVTSDGKNVFLNGNAQGINAPANYTGSGTKLTFGNGYVANAIGLNSKWTDKWGFENQLNQANLPYGDAKRNFQNCTFGLAQGITSDGKILYANGVSAPRLFNDGAAAGKTEYDGSMVFSRDGDTYTLTAASVGGRTTSNLNQFQSFGMKYGSDELNWQNSFWPLDNVPEENRKDPLSGTSTKHVKFSINNNVYYPFGSEKSDWWYASDDKKAHNNLFGMHFTVKFRLPSDYIGPLDYTFFGDDDMWVFLSEVTTDESGNITARSNGRLICDIGGVHAAVGEHVNLWNYIRKPDTTPTAVTKDTITYKEYALDFFYTERGYSGSNCWMQFTLPSVTVVEPDKTDYGSLRVEKAVEKSVNDGPYEVDKSGANGEEFQFSIHMQDAAGNSLRDDYVYTKYDSNVPDNTTSTGHRIVGSNLILWDQGTFTLKHGEYIVIEYLPAGTRYTITEELGGEVVTAEGTVRDSESSNYSFITSTTADGSQLQNSVTASGSITTGSTSEVKYVNRYKVFVLPKTGAFTPPEVYVLCGSALALASVVILRKRRKKARV